MSVMAYAQGLADTDPARWVLGGKAIKSLPEPEFERFEQMKRIWREGYRLSDSLVAWGDEFVVQVPLIEIDEASRQSSVMMHIRLRDYPADDVIGIEMRSALLALDLTPDSDALADQLSAVDTLATSTRVVRVLTLLLRSLYYRLTTLLRIERQSNGP